MRMKLAQVRGKLFAALPAVGAIVEDILLKRVLLKYDKLAPKATRRRNLKKCHNFAIFYDGIVLRPPSHFFPRGLGPGVGGLRARF